MFPRDWYENQIARLKAANTLLYNAAKTLERTSGYFRTYAQQCRRDLILFTWLFIIFMIILCVTASF